MRTLAKVLAGVVAAFVLLLVALALVLQSSAVSRRVKDLVVPRASAALGREVTVKDAKLRLLPRPRVALTDASVAGRPGEPPLVDLEALEVSLDVWPLVRSLGKEVRLHGVRLVKPNLNLVRANDGTWNYEGLGAGASTSAPKAGEGRAPGSRTDVGVAKAAIEDGAVRLIDRARGREAAVAVSKIQVAAEHVGIGQPLDATVSAAIAGNAKNFDARIHASALPESVAALGPGAWPELAGDLALDGLDLARLRAFLPPKLAGMMTGGRVDARAKLTTRDAKYAVDGKGKLSQLRLRGEPAQGSFAFHVVADPVSGAGRATVDDLAVKGPGIDLGGSATADLKPLRIRFAIAGPLLDLGQVMALVPDRTKPPPGTPLLTAEQRRTVGALDVAGTLDIQKVSRGPLAATAFKARTAFDEGVLVLRDARADLYGGKLDAGGTRIDLSEEPPAWKLAAKLDGVDLGQALTALSGKAPIVGKMTGGLDLSGAGVEWARLEKTVTGRGALALREGALTTTDLGQHVLGAVAQGLSALGKTAAAGKLGGATGRTELRDLAARFTVANGAMTLDRPVTFAAPFGAARLGGKIGLGGELELRGTATVSKQALTGILGLSGFPASGGLEVPLAMGGTLTSPQVNVDAREAVAGLAPGAAKQGKQQVEQEVDRARREARRGVGDLLRRFGGGK